VSRFVLTALRSGSGALRAGLPLGGDTTGIRATSDDSGELYYAVLDSPIRYRGADVRQVILRPAERGQAPHYGMRGFAVEIAPITDPALRTAEVIDPALLDFVAVGDIDDISDAPQPPRGDVGVEAAPDAVEAERPLPPPAPRPATRSSTPRSKRPLLIAASAVVLAAGIATMWITTSGDSADPSAATSAPPTPVVSPSTTQSSTVAPLEKPEAVLRLIPPGYQPGACTADAGVPVGARAALTCTRNVDPGGPESAHYTLFSDKATLQDHFNQVVSASITQVCPGRIMSPGPWRHNATPEITAGTLFCGTRQSDPVIAWTDDAKLLLAVVASPEQSSMEQMFTWWTSHS